MIDGLLETWASIDTLLAGLSAAQWALPTDCPGWNVQAQVAHLLGCEAQWYLGRTPGSVVDPMPAYVVNALGEGNEAWVVSRADRGPAEVLEEYREVIRARTKMLTAADLDLNAVSTTWRGDQALRNQLGTRLFDVWVHEQDIRRAVGIPGGWDEMGARHTIALMMGSLPYVLARKAGLADGSTVAITLFGVNAQTVTATVDEGRGRLVSAAERPPQAALTMHEETFVCITTGRKTAQWYLDAHKITLRGDHDLAQRVALNLSVLEV